MPSSDQINLQGVQTQGMTPEDENELRESKRHGLIPPSGGFESTNGISNFSQNLKERLRQSHEMFELQEIGSNSNLAGMQSGNPGVFSADNMSQQYQITNANHLFEYE